MTPDEVLAELAGELPPVSLLLGQLPGVRALAHKVAAGHEVHPADRISVLKLQADISRSIAELALVVPYGKFKVISICLDGATVQAQNILLKTLEEPPASVRFVLYGSQDPLKAVMSRCRVFRVGTGPGQRAEPGEDARGRAVSAVRAAQSGDPALLAQALRGWDEYCQAVLRDLCLGAAAGLPGTRGSPGITPGQALRVLEVLSRYPRARPANLAAAALSLAFPEET